MPGKMAMDDAAGWLAEIKGEIQQASNLLSLGFDRGDWKKVVEAGKVLRGLTNRLSNLEQLALPENWRMLAERNGVHVEAENDGTDQAQGE